jgi:hypothetical protein
MDAAKITAIVGLLVALSAASERLVEIVKGIFGWLDKQNADERQERLRKAVLQVLAVAAGIVTTLLARPAIPADLMPESSGVFPLIALGFLASGGSGLWNSVLTYLLKAKDIKEDLAKVADEKAKLAATVARDVASKDVDPRVGAEAMAKLSGM